MFFKVRHRTHSTAKSFACHASLQLGYIDGRYCKKTMNQELTQSPISVENPAFLRIVESKLEQGEPLVVLLRYSNSGGDRCYFLLKSIDDFQDMLRETHSKDALSIFFSQSFPIQGIVSLELRDKVIKLLEKIIQDGDDALFVIRLDTSKVLLGMDDMKCFSKLSQIDEWFKSHEGVPVVVDSLAFWQDDSEKMITAYVPDADGQVRPGAY